jgi:hypothetical protein
LKAYDAPAEKKSTNHFLMSDNTLRYTLRMRRGGLALASSPFRAILGGYKSYSALSRAEDGLSYLRSHDFKSSSFLSMFVGERHNVSVVD